MSINVKVNACSHRISFSWRGAVELFGEHQPPTIIRHSSFRRKPESRREGFAPLLWIPAFAGMTVSEQLYCSKAEYSAVSLVAKIAKLKGTFDKLMPMR